MRLHPSQEKLSREIDGTPSTLHKAKTEDAQLKYKQEGRKPYSNPEVQNESESPERLRNFIELAARGTRYAVIMLGLFSAGFNSSQAQESDVYQNNQHEAYSSLESFRQYINRGVEVVVGEKLANINEYYAPYTDIAADDYDEQTANLALQLRNQNIATLLRQRDMIYSRIANASVDSLFSADSASVNSIYESFDGVKDWLRGYYGSEAYQQRIQNEGFDFGVVSKMLDALDNVQMFVDVDFHSLELNEVAYDEMVVGARHNHPHQITYVNDLLAGERKALGKFIAHEVHHDVRQDINMPGLSNVAIGFYQEVFTEYPSWLDTANVSTDQLEYFHDLDELDARRVDFIHFLELNTTWQYGDEFNLELYEKAKNLLSQSDDIAFEPLKDWIDMVEENKADVFVEMMNVLA